MKITLTFKSPDVFDQIKEHIVLQKLRMKESSDESDDDDDDDYKQLTEEDEDQIEEIKTNLKEWIKWGEIIHLVYDTETGCLTPEKQK
jgi:hypothetical protein